MCYTNGPRCANEAMKSLNRAEASGNPQEIREAQHEYNLTPEGIQKLKDSGQEQLSVKYQAERDRKIALSKKITAERNNQKGRMQRFKSWANKNKEVYAARKATWGENVKVSLKTRRKKIVAVAGVGFLSVSLMTGCAVDNKAEYAAACQDAKSQTRVSDDKCSDTNGSNAGLYAWYFMQMGRNVPAVGQPLTGGVTSIPDSATRKAGVDTKGQTVTADGFGKKGASTKGGFGSGGAKGGGRGGGHGG